MGTTNNPDRIIFFLISTVAYEKKDFKLNCYFCGQLNSLCVCDILMIKWPTKKKTGSMFNALL